MLYREIYGCNWYATIFAFSLPDSLSCKLQHLHFLQYHQPGMFEDVVVCMCVYVCMMNKFCKQMAGI